MLRMRIRCNVHFFLGLLIFVTAALLFSSYLFYMLFVILFVVGALITL